MGDAPSSAHLRLADMIDVSIKAGDRCTVNRHANGNPVRVMAVAEGYAMVRYPGCSPFIEPVKDLRRLT